MPATRSARTIFLIYVFMGCFFYVVGLEAGVPFGCTDGDGVGTTVGVAVAVCGLIACIAAVTNFGSTVVVLISEPNDVWDSFVAGKDGAVLLGVVLGSGEDTGIDVNVGIGVVGTTSVFGVVCAGVDGAGCLEKNPMNALPNLAKTPGCDGGFVGFAGTTAGIAVGG